MTERWRFQEIVTRCTGTVMTTISNSGVGRCAKRQMLPEHSQYLSTYGFCAEFQLAPTSRGLRKCISTPSEAALFWPQEGGQDTKHLVTEDISTDKDGGID